MLTALSNDELQSIFVHLEFKDLLIIYRVCNQFMTYIRSERMIQILSLRLNMKNANFGQLLLRHYTNTIVSIITIPALYYNGYGMIQFEPPPLFLNEINPTLKEIYLNIASNNHLKIYKQRLGSWHQHEKELITDRTQIKDNYNGISIQFEVSFLTQQLKRQIPFKKVILRQRYEWLHKPTVEWYNIQSELELPSGQTLHCLNTYPYMRIDDPFVQISISAEIKRCPITIGDILFAGRCLFINKCCLISGNGNFRILNPDDHDVLCIEPDLLK